MSYNFILLNSFDRSGSTVISNALAKHPKIETLFNPLNATIFKKEFMTIWDPDILSNSQIEGKKILNVILNNKINKETIKSRVFFPNSSITKLKKEALHIIKTTNFHTKIKWFKYQYPNIPYWGLIRSPIEILASLVRNDFHKKWYGGWAYDDLLKNIEYFDVEDDARSEIKKLSDPIEQMAAIIACLNNEMIENINSEHIIIYENIIKDPNKELNKFCEKNALCSFDFSPYFNRSNNSSGDKYTGEKHYLKIFNEDQIESYKRIFSLFIGSPGYEDNSL